MAEYNNSQNSVGIPTATIGFYFSNSESNPLGLWTDKFEKLDGITTATGSIEDYVPQGSEDIASNLAHTSVIYAGNKSSPTLPEKLDAMLKDSIRKKVIVSLPIKDTDYTNTVLQIVEKYVNQEGYDIKIAITDHDENIAIPEGIEHIALTLGRIHDGLSKHHLYKKAV